MQQTLMDQNLDTNLIYRDISEMGYTDNHKKRILHALWDLQLHSNDTILKEGGKQYNARILELRRDGWDIRSMRVNGQFYFMLCSRQRRIF